MSDTQQGGPNLAQLLDVEQGTVGPPDLETLVNDEDREEHQPAPKQPAPDEAERAAADLRRQADNWRQRAEQATAESQRARQQLQQSEAQRQQSAREVEDSNYTAVMNAIAAREADIARHKVALRNALESGNYEAQVEAHDGIAQARADLSQLQTGKEQYEATRQQRLSHPEPQRLQQQPAQQEWTTVGVPRQQFMQQVSEPVRAWLRENDQFFTDASFKDKAIAAHHAALGEGIEDGSREYVDFIKERMAPVSDRTDPPTRQQQRQSGGAPSTPPSRDPARGSRGGNGGAEYLSPAERYSVARLLSMPDYKVTEADYVKGRQEAQRQGEWPYTRRR